MNKKLECGKCRETLIGKYYESPCKHIFCVSCQNIVITQRKSEFICPVSFCKQKIKTSQLITIVIKTNEEMELDKENNIRKDIQSQIGKKRDFFENEEEYNNYLMDFEDIILEKLENRDLSDADKKLEYYKEKFRKKEESGRIIVSNVKPIDREFLKKQKPPTYIRSFNNTNSTHIDIETLFIASGNEKKMRYGKGFQALQFIKKT